MTRLSPTALEAAARAMFANRDEYDDRNLNVHPAFEHDRGYWDGQATAAITAYLAQAEKEGWVMVPKEPTDEMYIAACRITRNPGYGHCHDAVGGAVYRAMLAAAQNGGA